MYFWLFSLLRTPTTRSTAPTYAALIQCLGGFNFFKEYTAGTHSWLGGYYWSAANRLSAFCVVSFSFFVNQCRDTL